MTDRLTIMLLTYAADAKSERAKYAMTTLRSVLDNLRYDGEIAVHIADDGSPDAHRATLRKLAGGYKHVVAVGESNAKRRGYGASYNLATQAVHPGTGFVLPLEDDWELVRELDVTPFVLGLDGGRFGCVRLGYLGTTQELRGRVLHSWGKTYLELDPTSPEPHVWAGHPRIETVEWQRDVGPWPEGLEPGSTEFAVAHIPAARDGVVFPLYWDMSFAHIGTVQAREDQKQEVATA